MLIEPANAADYLRQTGRIGPDERAEARALGGGVSNQVIYIGRDPPELDFVLKQARPQLRTPQPWFCTVERIWREVDVLAAINSFNRDPLGERVGWSVHSNNGLPCRVAVKREPEGTANARDDVSMTTPRILFEDRENYLYAMSAAPSDHRTWKSDLLAGRFDSSIAAACGRFLGRLHGATWGDDQLRQRLGDRQVFIELRLDPYYRATAAARPEAAPFFERLVESVLAHPRCLVHADFSPKNILVDPGGLTLVDFETGHYGDPAFDLGFFLSHLVLKAFHHAPRSAPLLSLADDFWAAYLDQLSGQISTADRDDMVVRALQNLAGCAWARLDGTSQIDYLDAPSCRDAVRQLCRRIFDAQPRQWADVRDAIAMSSGRIV